MNPTLQITPLLQYYVGLYAPLRRSTYVITALNIGHLAVSFISGGNCLKYSSSETFVEGGQRYSLR